MITLAHVAQVDYHDPVLAVLAAQPGQLFDVLPVIHPTVPQPGLQPVVFLHLGLIAVAHVDGIARRSERRRSADLRITNYRHYIMRFNIVSRLKEIESTKLNIFCSRCGSCIAI